MALSTIQKWERDSKFDRMRYYKSPRSDAYRENYDRIFKQGKYAEDKKCSTTTGGETETQK